MANFSQRDSGKWQAKIRRRGFPDNSKTFQTLEAAQQWARAIEREMDIGAFVMRNDAERTTFSEAASRYKTEILPQKKSIQQCESVIRILCEQFGKYSLASINPAMLSAYRDQRLKCVKPQTVVHELNMVSKIFKACAMDWGIALPQGIPTALVRKPKIESSRDRRLEPGEWDLLHAALLRCKSVYPLAIVEFAIETAARQSEILSLKWDDVDLKKRTAKLRGVDGRTTKSADVFRHIPLTTRAVEILTALPRQLKRGSRVFSTTQSAFVQSWKHALIRARKSHILGLLSAALDLQKIDGPAQVRALIYKKKPVLQLTTNLLQKIEQANTDLQNLHFHDLRHEATSRLAEKLQMHELMKVTGHKSSSMIARYYHPRASDLAQKLG